MAMAPGSVVVPEKVQFPSAAIGNEMVHQQPHHPRPQWFAIDERDGFISWLRGEFAAANAIIDSLCHHLRVVGEPGEYDLVVGSILQRRCNWNPVLHLQQYFSIGEVIFALQQVSLKKQQQQQRQPYPRFYSDQPKVGGKDFRKSSGVGFKGHRGSGLAKEVVPSNVENHNSDRNSLTNIGVEKLGEVKSGGDGEKFNDEVYSHAEEQKEATANLQEDSQPMPSENSKGNSCTNLLSEAVAVDNQSNHIEDDSHSSQDNNEKQSLSITPKTFVGPEIIDGKMVNVVDGLKLYEQFLNDMEISKLVSLVTDLRASGRKGQFQGQTYVVSKRPWRGHGREMIQFGIPIDDANADDENAAGSSKERKIDSIPTLLQDVIERLVGMQAISVKPDSCIIDVYNEGDHSQPYMWPSWYGKPVSVLFLTGCDIVFGRVIVNNHPGDYRGSLRLALSPGSLLVMQGKSSNFTRHALPAIRKQRILVTFAKSQPKRISPSDGPRLNPTNAALSSHWGPPPSRSPNHSRHPVPSRSPNHFAANPSAGVLPAPTIQPQMAPNGVQPLFVTAPVAPLPFPAAVPLPVASTAWPVASPSCLPVPPPGTGVFLPPSGPGNASSPMNFTTPSTEEAALSPDRGNGSLKSNRNANTSLKERLDVNSRRQDCNGSGDVESVTREEKTDNSDTDNEWYVRERERDANGMS